MQLLSTTVRTPLGAMVSLWGDHGLLALSWADRQAQTLRHLRRHLGVMEVREVANLPALSQAIHAYLNGNLTALGRLPVAPPGTSFQRCVWAALREIPVGQTWSYGQLARHIGRPTAYRAVAQANGANPVPLVIPCHRVIGSDGGLGGFSAGLPRKRWLLSHEGAWEATG